VDSTSGQLDDLLGKAERLAVSTSAILKELVARDIDATPIKAQDQNRIEEAQEETPDSADGRYDAIRDEWDNFVTLLRTAFGRSDQFDARQVGRMAYLMVDGRRKNQLSESEAEQIAQLHTQFKSFARLYQTREDWLTPEVFQNFSSRLRQATQILHRATR
jgi:hypothetical protein